MAAPNLKEIEWAIHELENEESSKSGYAMLAALYTCRNEMAGTQQSQITAYSMADGPVAEAEALGLYGDSEFFRTIEGKDPMDVWTVMDDLMDTLRVSFPRVYNRVMREIREIK